MVTHSSERVWLISADLFDILASLLDGCKKKNFFFFSILGVHNSSSSILGSKGFIFILFQRNVPSWTRAHYLWRWYFRSFSLNGVLLSPGLPCSREVVPLLSDTNKILSAKKSKLFCYSPGYKCVYKCVHTCVCVCVCVCTYIWKMILGTRPHLTLKRLPLSGLGSKSYEICIHHTMRLRTIPYLAEKFKIREESCRLDQIRISFERCS